MSKKITTVTTEHIDLLSSKSFEQTVKDLTAELGKASTEKLMDRLSASDHLGGIRRGVPRLRWAQQLDRGCLPQLG